MLNGSVSLECGNEISNWAERNFSGAFSTDKRRNRRIIAIAESQAKFPGRPLPQLFSKPYDTKAAYNLFQHPESTPDLLQRGHRELVDNELNLPGTYLLIEDTSSFSWSGKAPIEGLGPIGDFTDGYQGFELHSVLVTRWETSQSLERGKRPPLSILGLADQQYSIRKRVPNDKKSNRSHTRKGAERSRETDVWLNSVERIGKHPGIPGVNWVRVCDRGADLYEVLAKSEEYGYSYVIRAAQDRVLLDNDNQRIGTVFSYAKNLVVEGTYKLSLRGRSKASARTATLGVSYGSVQIRSPQRLGYSVGKLPPISCSIVYVKELDPPEGVKAIEWILICSHKITCFNEAMICILQYASRWIIEEFHKALKSGLKAEMLQLGNANRLFAAIAIMSIVALRLLDLKEKIRLNPEAPAKNSGLDDFDLKFLRAYLKRRILTIEEVGLAIGRLGGHMNRKGDGLPGMITLWRGMARLKELSEGARFSIENKLFTKFG